MESTQQSWYSQMPGGYPAEEDEESETLLQMMNDLAEEECNVGPRQSQHSQTAGLAGRQHKHASQTVPTQGTSYQTPASRQPPFASKNSPAKRHSHQKPADRHHPYARPSVPVQESGYQMSEYGSHRMIQTGPIRHGRKLPRSQGSGISQPRFDPKEPPAQQRYSKDYPGYVTKSVAEAEKAKEDNKKEATRDKGLIEEKESAKAKGKGQTRLRNGRLECPSDPDLGPQRWVPAIRMDECRRELIDQQNRLAAQYGMRYRDPDPVGTGFNDETAFKIEHADWGSDRQHLPDICWRFNEDEANHPRPSKNPGYMMFKGMIVLDPSENPIKNWSQLPLTLSSKTRGYRLEMMSRENPHLEYKDFIARMPSVIQKPKKNKATGEMETVLEAPDPNGVCNMRMYRFRREKGLLSWTEKGKTKVIGEGLERLFGNRLINNSMKSFGRDLTPYEQTEISKGNNAQFPTEDPARSDPKKAATKKGNKNGATKTSKQPNNAKAQKAPQQKRPREDDEDSDSADDQDFAHATAASYRKRRRNARGGASKPVVDLHNHQHLSTAGTPRNIVDPTSHAPNNAFDEKCDEDGDTSEDEDDGEYENTRSHRAIHPLPARRTHGAKMAQPFTPVQTQERYIYTLGSSEPQLEASDSEDDEEMTDTDDLTDVPGSGSPYTPAEEEEEQEVVEEDKEEQDVTLSVPPPASLPVPPLVPPPVPQETDLERHRRVVREFLGEEDDFHFLPFPNPPWIETTLFTSIPWE